MKVLFVSSGNKYGKPTSVVYNQGESLKKSGILIDYYLVVGKGFSGYIKNIFKLKKFLKTNSYDIVHAHYSLSGIVASLSFKSSVIVSLMGSDVKSAGLFRVFIKTFNRFFWKATIVKSADMKKTLGLENLHVIPNGVDMNKFHSISKLESLKKTGFNRSGKQILFAADPDRPEKNFQLANMAFKQLNGNDVELHYLKAIPNELMPYYYNSADVVLLTSLWEGSPNVIKEALACNRPVVATNVGDIKELIDNLNGCYIADFDPEDVANKIKSALNNSEEIEGRKRLQELKLNEEAISRRIIDIYNKVLNN